MCNEHDLNNQTMCIICTALKFIFQDISNILFSISKFVQQFSNEIWSTSFHGNNDTNFNEWDVSSFFSSFRWAWMKDQIKLIQLFITVIDHLMF